MSGKAKPIDYRVNETGCHLCSSHVPGDGGYIKIVRDGKQYSVHRYVWEQTYGPIPRGLYVCHSCDNPTCINPEHLFLGTAQENNRDRDEKNRHWVFHGSDVGTAKLNDAQALEIFHSPKSQRHLAAEYGISQATVSRIKNREMWAHLTIGQERNDGAPDRIYVSGNQRAVTMKRSPDDVEYIKVSIMEQTMERMRAERENLRRLAWSTREWFYLRGHKDAAILVETMGEVELDIQKAIAVQSTFGWEEPHDLTQQEPIPTTESAGSEIAVVVATETEAMSDSAEIRRKAVHVACETCALWKRSFPFWWWGWCNLENMREHRASRCEGWSFKEKRRNK